MQHASAIRFEIITHIANAGARGLFTSVLERYRHGISTRERMKCVPLLFLVRFRATDTASALPVTFPALFQVRNSDDDESALSVTSKLYKDLRPA